LRKLFLAVLIITIIAVSASAKPNKPAGNCADVSDPAAFAEQLVYAGSRVYDVAVVGGGCGGCAAAIQAARDGASVIVIEPTGMLGGQMTSAAVSTMDDRGMTRTGIYKEFIDTVRDYYAARGKSVECCYWGDDTIAFEPAAGARILEKMLDAAGVDVIYNTVAVSAKTKENKVTAATFRTVIDNLEMDNIHVRAKLFIDATECGDFLPLTPAKFRAGRSVSPKIDKEGVIQDITYVAVVKKYPLGLPEELRVDSMPPKYVEYIDEFRGIVTKDGHTWPEGYPYNVDTHNEYRGLPDSATKLNVSGGNPNSWKNITKTCLNWANDYPGRTYADKQKSLPVTYLTEKKVRDEINRAAMEKTLCFIYYMQHELGMADWSVSDEGYKSQAAYWRKDKDLKQYGGVLQYFPCQPYVRESRRLVGVKTVTVKDIMRVPELKRTEQSIDDSVALGEYPVDMHGMIEDKYLEADLGETKASVPNDWQVIKAGLFQLPLGALIPESVDGLLAAEKNISVSRTVNGATRLQPVTMLTGQAAGALAAIAVKQKVQPRQVEVSTVQKKLLESGDKLSIFTFDDVPAESDIWKHVEFAMLHGYIIPNGEHLFGTETPVSFLELRETVYKMTGLKDKTFDLDPFASISCNAAAAWLAEVAGKQKKIKRFIREFAAYGDRPFTKADLAKFVWNIAE